MSDSNRSPDDDADLRDPSSVGLRPTPSPARGEGQLTRRLILASGLALPLAACGRDAKSEDVSVEWRGQPQFIRNGGSLKSLAPFRIGCCVQASQTTDPAFTDLLTRHFSQITPEWEMKMEYIVQPDGSFRFDRPDAIAAFARSRGLRLFGHTLVWYANEPEGFVKLDESRQSFQGALENYVTAVVSRYRGLAVGWDVVNEPIKDDSTGPRESLWSRKLGQIGHFKVAFDAARAADPDAILFTNDYHLESKPQKLASYMRLIEQLLQAGVPLGGIGCQTHCDSGLAPGSISRALKALAGFGLPIHLSEMDVMISGGGPFASQAEAEQRQARLYGEAMEAYAALPEHQQFAFSVWGLRDKDSWIRRDIPSDEPLLFDDQGQPKATFAAVADALRR